MGEGPKPWKGDGDGEGDLPLTPPWGLGVENHEKEAQVYGTLLFWDSLVVLEWGTHEMEM